MIIHHLPEVDIGIPDLCLDLCLLLRFGISRMIRVQTRRTPKNITKGSKRTRFEGLSSQFFAAYLLKKGERESQTYGFPSLSLPASPLHLPPPSSCLLSLHFLFPIFLLFVLHSLSMYLSMTAGKSHPAFQRLKLENHPLLN